MITIVDNVARDPQPAIHTDSFAAGADIVWLEIVFSKRSLLTDKTPARTAVVPWAK